MIRALLATIVLIAASPAAAQDCPDFYRFVDFGIEDSEGRMYRGGPLLRAENFDEDRLLLEAQTDCIDVWPTLTDGRGNPIPVVQSIEYDTNDPRLDLTLLRISRTDDALHKANAAASQHRDWHLAPSTVVERGTTFLCLSPSHADVVSCQVSSPFQNNFPVVASCDADTCTLPVLSINEGLVVEAQWPAPADGVDDTRATGEHIITHIDQIYAFLSPLSASF